MLEKKVVSQCISSDYCRGWNDAADAMPRWISVEERLPEDGMEVIVYTIYGDVTWAYYRYSRMEWFRNCIRFTQTVTHWMPMPEAPKEDSHG